MGNFRIENPNYRPIIIPVTSASGGGGATNAGVAAFSSSGSGAGTDFVDIVFLVPMLAGYAIDLTVAVVDGTLRSPPEVFYDTTLKTINGFRIYPQAPFDGEVSWAVFNKTQ